MLIFSKRYDYCRRIVLWNRLVFAVIIFMMLAMPVAIKANTSVAITPASDAVMDDAVNMNSFVKADIAVQKNGAIVLISGKAQQALESVKIADSTSKRKNKQLKVIAQKADSEISTDFTVNDLTNIKNHAGYTPCWLKWLTKCGINSKKTMVMLDDRLFDSRPLKQKASRLLYVGLDNTCPRKTHPF